MIYVFMADGTEEVEAVATIDMLRRAELDVMTLGIGSQMIVGSHGIGLVCDADAKNIEPDETMQAVVIPGGMPGTLNIEKSAVAQKFIDYASENGKLICAICAAPSVLGHKGLLRGKRATCFPGFEKELEGDGRILVRCSGTEPLVRVMVEAKSDELCHKYVYQVVEIIEKNGY